MEGLGEKGKAVLLAGEEQRQGEAANKVWAFNKVRLCLHTYFRFPKNGSFSAHSFNGHYH